MVVDGISPETVLRERLGMTLREGQASLPVQDGKGQQSWMEMIICPDQTREPEGCVIHTWVQVQGHSSKILDMCDGDAEVALMSHRLYRQ